MALPALFALTTHCVCRAVCGEGYQCSFPVRVEYLSHRSEMPLVSFGLLCQSAAWGWKPFSLDHRVGLLPQHH